MLRLISFPVLCYIGIFRCKMTCIMAQKDSHTVANCPWRMLSLNPTQISNCLLSCSSKSLPASCRQPCLLCDKGGKEAVFQWFCSLRIPAHPLSFIRQRVTCAKQDWKQNAKALPTLPSMRLTMILPPHPGVAPHLWGQE